MVAGETLSAEPSMFKSRCSKQRHYHIQVELNTRHLKALCCSDYLRPGSERNKVMGVDNTGHGSEYKSVIVAIRKKTSCHGIIPFKTPQHHT